MVFKGSISRIRNCAFDLLSLDEDLMDDDEESWELVGRELRLKSTFLYCDLTQVISNVDNKHKETLTQFGNRLFHYLEELGDAVNNRSISVAQACYKDLALALLDVMVALGALH